MTTHRVPTLHEAKIALHFDHHHFQRGFFSIIRKLKAPKLMPRNLKLMQRGLVHPYRESAFIGMVKAILSVQKAPKVEICVLKNRQPSFLNFSWAVSCFTQMSHEDETHIIDLFHPSLAASKTRFRTNNNREVTDRNHFVSQKRRDLANQMGTSDCNSIVSSGSLAHPIRMTPVLQGHTASSPATDRSAHTPNASSAKR